MSDLSSLANGTAPKHGVSGYGFLADFLFGPFLRRLFNKNRNRMWFDFSGRKYTAKRGNEGPLPLVGSCIFWGQLCMKIGYKKYDDEKVSTKKKADKGILAFVSFPFGHWSFTIMAKPPLK